MAMQKREKVLAGVTAALLVTSGGAFMLRGGGSSSGNLRAEYKSLEQTIEQQEQQKKSGIRPRKQLSEWRKRSLPGEPGNFRHARALYGDWLSELAVDRVKLGGAVITPLVERPGRGDYTILPFRVEGRGTWEQLVQFLYHFESAGFLHKIRQLSRTPGKGPDDLKLVFDIEALCVEGALSGKPPKGVKLWAELESLEEYREARGLTSRLEHDDVGEYVKTIVRRKLEPEKEDPSKYRIKATGGLFASYEPLPPPRPPRRDDGPPPPPPKPQGIDVSEHTYVSAMVQPKGVPEIWLRVRMEDRTIAPLREGDSFEVGKVHGIIRRIRMEEKAVEMEIDGQRWVVALNQSLGDRVELRE